MEMKKRTQGPNLLPSPHARIDRSPRKTHSKISELNISPLNVLQLPRPGSYSALKSLHPCLRHNDHPHCTHKRI